jgi:choline dehydrogenase-like flavoprotein
MVHDARSSPRLRRADVGRHATTGWPAGATDLRAEVAVIGSGPGGAVTACLLAEAGRDVLLIEEGPAFPPGSVPEFSLDEMVTKYRNGGITVGLGPAKVAYVEGRCVGGGSEINSGLYHRTPPDVLARWRRDYRVAALDEADLRPHFEACERDLTISYLPGAAPAASLKLHQGAERLGWRSLEVPRWFRYDATADPAAPAPWTRQTMSQTYIPRALRAGGWLIADTRVRSLRRDGSGWSLRCSTRAGGGATRGVQVNARTVFVCGGAIQTPTLLRRSGITRNVGNSLHMHPTVKIVARFPEPVNSARMGVPVHQVKEFAPRISFGCSISSPAYLALALIDHPERLQSIDREWTHMAVYYAMISGNGRGTLRVLPGFSDPLVRYRVTNEDLSELSTGIRRLGQLLLGAGAVELFPSIVGVAPIRTEAELEQIPSPLPKSRSNLMTIHLTSSCPFGEEARLCAADSFGKVHGVDDLYIADASLLCTQPSVNPQGSIMAIARRNAMHFLGQL